MGDNSQGLRQQEAIESPGCADLIRTRTHGNVIPVGTAPDMDAVTVLLLADVDVHREANVRAVYDSKRDRGHHIDCVLIAGLTDSIQQRCLTIFAQLPVVGPLVEPALTLGLDESLQIRERLGCLLLFFPAFTLHALAVWIVGLFLNHGSVFPFHTTLLLG
jgi:hypothetical protein